MARNPAVLAVLVSVSSPSLALFLFFEPLGLPLPLLSPSASAALLRLRSRRLLEAGVEVAELWREDAVALRLELRRVCRLSDGEAEEEDAGPAGGDTESDTKWSASSEFDDPSRLQLRDRVSIYDIRIY